MARKVNLTRVSWHPGYPFRRPSSRSRRIASIALLVLLITLIATYWYITDSARVRAIAEFYLSEAVGGDVTVGRARLSIFEGLRLDDVRIGVPGAEPAEPPLFSASMVYLRIPIADVLRRDFSATSIVAVEPRVTLISDSRARTWNFQSLRRPDTASTRPPTETPIGRITLPQLLLRSGRVDYVERVGDRELVTRGSLAVEGNLIPDPAKPDYLTFAITARGSRDRPGTSLTGWAYLSTGQLSARLQNFDLGREFLTMLPAPVRTWWELHEIAGNVEIPELSVEPVPAGSTTRPFRVVTVFRGGAISLLPEDLVAYDPDDQGDRGEPGPPVRFEDVRGELIFTQDGIELRDMSLLLEGSRIRLSGALEGYSPGAPLIITLSSDALHLPERPAFVSALPPLIREIYHTWSPSGEGSFAFRITRNAAGKVSTDGRLDITRGRTTFDKFPYPVHDVTGSIVVTSIAPGHTRLEARDIRGRGRPDGANRDASLRVEGFMEPLEFGSEVNFQVHGDGVTADEELVAAMPPQVREVLRRFDDTARGFPHFAGSFSAEVYRQPGRVSRWRWPIDIRLSSGSGRFQAFPYPLDHVTGRILIETGVIHLDQMRSSRGDARLTVDGKVLLTDDGLDFDLDVDARDVPIDATLIDAVEPGKRQWLDNLGPSGTLDLRGRIEGPAGVYDLQITVRDGELRPALRAPLPPGTDRWTASDLNAQLRLTPTDLTILRATGQRLSAPLSVTGHVDWGENGGDEVRLTLEGTALRLPVDPALRSILGDAARAAWDAVLPEGRADLHVRLKPDAPPEFRLRPLGLTATPAVVPVQLRQVNGEVIVRGTDISLLDLTAVRGDSPISLGGTGSTRPDQPWDVTLRADQLRIDGELRAALPALLRTTAESLGLDGVVDLHLSRFRYIAATPGAGQPVPDTGTTATASPGDISVAASPTAPAAEADFDVLLVPRELTASLGVPVRVTSGRVDLRGSVRDGRLATLSGELHFPTGEISGRAFRELRTRVAKTADRDGMMFDAISATLADGELSGFAAIAFPPGESTRYGLDLSLRNADVAVLVGKLADTPLSGRMSASLTLQGDLDNPATRRGRGDLSVTGERMARVPVLLGLVQIANLSLPGGTSFNNATARYNMDGPRVTLEQLVLRSPGMQIDGAGYLDLDNRQVRLSLWTTGSSDLPRVPIFSDLADRTRRELLQIQIRGTINNPRIGASSFDSFTTTVDEVFRSSGRGEHDSPSPRR